MTGQPPKHTLHVKKYPNRRFYDQTRSRHVKLDELYQLVRDGHEIVVTDSAGNDITNIVLTQLILEHDPPKLDLFPATLLHQAIQANQDMVRMFVDQYFSRAMDAFMTSRQQFDAFLAKAGLSPMQPMTPLDWAQRFLFGMTHGAAANGAAPTADMADMAPHEQSPASDPSQPSGNDDLSALRDEIHNLKSEVQRLRETAQPKSRKNAPRKN